METFSALLAICAGNSPVSGEFPAQRPVARSFDVFFDLRVNKRLSKQSSGWWFETLSRPFCRHRNDKISIDYSTQYRYNTNVVSCLPTPIHLLTHNGQETPYGDIGVSQHWLR